MSAALEDVARFGIDDDPYLVEASFCCQLCLRQPALVVVAVGDKEGRAGCYCAACDAETEVRLNAAQVLRLRLAPPRGSPIRLVGTEDV